MFDRITDKGLKRRIKQHVIALEHKFFASVQPGFEQTLSRELSSFGLSVSPDYIEGGVEFTGDLSSCYRACMLSRTASRIIMRIAEFKSHNYFELERNIRNFPWELYITKDTPIDFSISSSNSMIYHTGKLKEIFQKNIKERLGEDLLFFDGDYTSSLTLLVRNYKNIATVSIDASGEFLYKRGIKIYAGKASLRETLASLILLEANLNDYDVLLDPMCGSGTFSIEAALIWTKTPPNIDRAFPFRLWPSFKERNFNYVKSEILKEVIAPEKTGKAIITSDIDREAVAIACKNVPSHLRDFIKPDVDDFFSLKESILPKGKSLIVLNPPYGKRIKASDTNKLYKEIGSKIRRDFRKCNYAIIAPGEEAEKALALPYKRKIPFKHGGIPVAVIFSN
ncbi:MAG: Ribosomal RNA large subunit methyltransferase L [Spirochaetes bacterium ADurb.Bin218]|jgi:putative N6-adenine-specific DNA methylase|nr:hypothetical protein [Spirochaetota bacterium]OQA99590.1 MAG: Ribosomal RNA large subunit methyltransferase L [Spirochaetes bacterium ADurb.Bin218]HOQ12854.1 hypothetical protein [Spirochaetota bacterium]